MQKEDKERVVAELTERLRTAETLIVSDYRGLTMPQIDGLRGKLLEHGARLSVVKNTLTRRAAEAAGVESLLALLEGPSAIAFIESEGDAVAVAKALADSARETRILTVRGGIMQGRVISGDDVGELAKLPPLDILRGQVIGAIIAPLNALLGLVNAPLQNLVGLIDARLEQLEAGGDTSGSALPTEPTEPSEPEAGAEAEPTPEAETESVQAEAVTAIETAEPEAQAETAEPEAPATEPESENQEETDGGS
jgi:large subunit ribosomal protein L10